MKLEFIALVFCVVVVLVSAVEDKSMLKFEGENEENINDLLKKMSGGNYRDTDINDSESSGDDEQESGSGSGDEGGSGSVVTPTKTLTTSKEDKSSPSVVDITLVASTKKPKETTTMGNCVECGEKTQEPSVNENNVGESDEMGGDGNGKKKTEKGGVNFTVGIIIGVVVGAILAIVIIVFLVYRLRKKDEGSYCLDEQSSTAYLRADTETKDKEYFA